MKSCYFIGHREADERLLPLLGKAIEKLITEDRVAYFYVGAYGGVDRIVTTALKAAKKKYPNIVLMRVLPYHPADRTVKIPESFDGTYYPDGIEKVPKRYAIVRTNRVMIDAADWLITYVRHGASNSCRLLEYAERRQEKGLIQIENLAEKM